MEGAEEKESTSREGVKTQLNTAQEVQNKIHIKAKECKKMKLSQDMHLIQKLRDDQKCMKKVHENMCVRFQAEEIKMEYSRRSRSLKTISRNIGLHSYRFACSKYRAIEDQTYLRLNFKRNHKEDKTYLRLNFNRNYKDLKTYTPSSTKELATPYKEPERVFRSSRKLSKTRSFDYLSLLEFNLLSDPEDQFEEEETEAMREPTMEEYMTKT
ncbi:hypothetical protein Tco_0410431 [Tanacetum coccineum]